MLSSQVSVTHSTIDIKVVSLAGVSWKGGGVLLWTGVSIAAVTYCSRRRRLAAMPFHHQYQGSGRAVTYRVRPRSFMGGAQENAYGLPLRRAGY